MNREQAKELQKAFNHFANGGDLWNYNRRDKIWTKQDRLLEVEPQRICNVIKDKNFEARKAFALGGEVEFNKEGYGKWMSTFDPQWFEDTKYRPKPKDVYEWQWIKVVDNKIIDMTRDCYPIYSTTGWTKFEPSKRIRHD